MLPKAKRQAFFSSWPFLVQPPLKFFLSLFLMYVKVDHNYLAVYFYLGCVFVIPSPVSFCYRIFLSGRSIIHRKTIYSGPHTYRWPDSSQLCFVIFFASISDKQPQSLPVVRREGKESSIVEQKTQISIMSTLWFILLTIILSTTNLVLTQQNRLPPPLPIIPLPTAAQLKWQQREIIMFFHFGMNTFTDSEWGTGHENPKLFDPSSLNADQWAQGASDAGVSLVILTVKHHDGFCLWPSRYTDHSVKSSPWKGGKGDVVKEFVQAAQAKGLDVGLYLSPWDRHEKIYGLELQYNEFYMGQLQEILNGDYGRISEIWFDGAKGKNATNMTYYFNDWFSIVKQMQGSINIFSDAGPDIRWVGGETGTAGTTCWSPINRSSLRIGDANLEGYLNTGDPNGSDWIPPECDVSIRDGWFWHRNQTPKAVDELLHIYYTSVGRNCVLLLNVPPNTSGLVSEIDVERLMEFRSALTAIFSANFVESATAKASSQRGGKSGGFTAANVLDDNMQTYWSPKDSDKDPWLELKFRKPVKFNVVKIQEAITLGQRIVRHEVYVKPADDRTETDRSADGWTKGVMVANGTTVGYKRLHRLGSVVQAVAVWIHVSEARALPLISSIGLHFDPYSKGQIS